MKTFANILGRAALGVAVLLSVACQRDPVPAPTVQDPVGNRDGYVSIPVSIGQAPIVETKGAMLNDPAVESVGSGAIILVYMDGLLTSQYYFSQAEIDNQGSTPLMIEAPLGVCDFYILGNLNAIHKTSGDRASLLDVLSESDLASEATLETLSYRLDGGDIPSSGYRRQTMAEVGTYGLPYRHVVKNVNTGLTTGIPGSNSCKRLFSKVTVIIDHSAFDGGIAGNVGYFVNKNLYMRQVNARLTPFSDAAVKATESADLVTGAYDDAMSNAGLGTYVFYVPENMQGTVSGITNQQEKTASNIPSAMASCATYVEFTGTLDKAAGGFGGDVTYKFFLGANNTTDFNVEHGKNYEVTLGFTADGLFNPYWKVNASLTDSRLFAFTADASGATDIGNVNASRNLLVRKNRPGAMYVYMNRDGDYGASNALVGKEYAASESMAVSSLSDCAWYGAMMVSSTEDAAWLSARGITPDWDAANAKLSFTVTDPSKFNAHLGESRSLSAKLLPNGQTAAFHLVLAEDMVVTVADGLSLTNDFYMGQKRTVSASGFQGTNVKYAAVQEQCGASSSSAKNSNVQWKAVNTGDFGNGYPSCAVDGNGNVVLNPENSAYADQSFTGTLDVYAWYPNKFLSSHSGWSSKSAKLLIFSEDWMNDSFEIPITISEPRLSLPAAPTNYGSKASPVVLPIDGTNPDGIGFRYFDYNGSSVLKTSSFDETLYGKVLAPSFQILDDNNNIIYPAYSSCVGTMADFSDTDSEKTDLCIIKNDYGTGTLLELEDMSEILYDPIGEKLLGKFRFSGNSSAGLYDGTTDFYLAVQVPIFKTNTLQNGFQQDKVYTEGLECPDLRIKIQPLYPGNVVVYNLYKFVIRGEDDHVLPPCDLDLRLGLGHINKNSLENISINYSSGWGLPYFDAKNGTRIEPIIDTEILNPETAPAYRWCWSPDRQTTWAGTEYVPGRLMAPYGVQYFTIYTKNIHSNENINCGTKEVNIMYEFTPVTLFVMNDGNSGFDVRTYVVTPWAAYYLTEWGRLMSPEGRLFCQKVANLDVAGYFEDSEMYGDLGPATATHPVAIYHADGKGTYPPNYTNPGDTPKVAVNGYPAHYLVFSDSYAFNMTSSPWYSYIWEMKAGQNPSANAFRYRFVQAIESSPTGITFPLSNRILGCHTWMQTGYTESVFIHKYRMYDDNDDYNTSFQYGRAFLDLTGTGQSFDHEN